MGTPIDYSLQLVFLRSFLVSLVPAFKKLKAVQKYKAKMELLTIRRKAKNTRMVFQPGSTQCFSASTTFSFTYEYNFQSQDLSRTSQIPNTANVTVKFSSVSDTLPNGLYKFLDFSYIKL